jgi:hypothetical protein
MKGKFSSIWRLTLALALVLTLVLVMAAPVAASTAVTVVWVQPESYTASASTIYHVYFTTGHALTAGVDTITVLFPVNTVPTDAVAVTVDPDGDAVAAATTTTTADVDGYRLEVTTPVDIAAGSEVRLDIPSVKNPSTTATNYTLNVYTSQETTLVESSTYRMGATSVTGVTVVATTTYIAGEVSVYTIDFTATTALAVGNTITVVFPVGTYIPAIAASAVTIDGTVLTAAPVIAGRFVTLTIPAAWSVDSTPQIVFLLTAGIKNPTYASSTAYGAKVYTSKALGIVSKDLSAVIVAGSISQVAFKDTAVVVDSEDTVMVSTDTPLVTRYATLTIETRDHLDNPKAVAADTVFALTSSSGTGHFSTDASTWTATSATISSAAATKVFYYKDTAVGNATITVTETVDGVLTDTWVVEVTSETEVGLYDGDTLVEEYATIQAAITDALPGNVIKVGPGVYREQLRITNSDLTIESTDGADSTTIYYDGYFVVEILSASTTGKLGVNVTLDGFTITSSGSWGSGVSGESNQFGIYVRGVSGFTIKNNKFIDIQKEGIMVYSENGAITSGTIDHNTFIGMREHSHLYRSAIGVQGYSGNAISGVTISDNTISGYGTPVNGVDASGIKLADTGAGAVTDITVSGNVISDSYIGLFIWGSLTTGTNAITNNTISGCRVGVAVTSDGSGACDSDFSLVGNTITDNTEYGVHFWDRYTSDFNGAGVVDVQFNNISGNGIYGILFDFATHTDHPVATHNYWGDDTGPSAGTGTYASTAVGSGDAVSTNVTYYTASEPWLGASVSAGGFATGAAALDAQATVGVKVSGADSSSQKIGAARYTANPAGTTEFTPLEDGFFDVYVAVYSSATEVSINFYDAAITSDSVAYMWDALGETWELCTEQGAISGMVWVKARPYSATAPAVPTIQDLNGTPFAIRGGAVSTIALDEDWNFISVPKRMATTKDTFGELLTGIDYARAFSYNSVSGLFVTIGNSTSVAPLEGYWIDVNTAGTITLSYAQQGETVPPTKVLTGDAWNAIGHSSTSDLTAGNTLMSIADSWSTLIGWNAATQAYDAAIIHPGTGVSDLMLPGKGYWIWMTQDDTLSAISG